MGKQEDDALKRRRSSEVLIAVTLALPIVLSSLSLFSYNGLSQSGSWTDLFDDESKISQKSNVVVLGGDVSLGPGGMKWFRQGMVLDVGPVPSTYESSGWPSVVKGSDGIYRMWYTGTQFAIPVRNRYIHYATSVDGHNWDRKGIVIGPNATFEDRVYAATVIEDGGIYKMWYVGDDLDWPWGSYIFYATSPDGFTWTRQGLVLPLGFEGTYDSFGASFPAVMKDGVVYKMWYSGYDGTHYRILHAISLDGQSWTYQNLAIDIGTNPDDYDYWSAFEPAVVKDVNGVYHMWYSGNNGALLRILNATSPDGVTWTKQGLSLDVLPNSQEDVGVLSGTVIMLPNSVVTMWYEGVDSFGEVRIFRATLGGSGHVVSEAIGPHPGCDWGDFFANKTDPNADIFVAFSVLDAVDWTVIPGYWNLTDVQFSLLSIDPLVHPAIRLRADLWNLQGNFTLIPKLHDWTITWTDPNPPPPDNMPPEIFGVLLDGDSVLFIIEGTPSVTLTATVDDSMTGGSIVGGANATSPARAWLNSTPMNPIDALDTSVEGFLLTIDTSPLSVGSYDICVYGWDVVPNYNETGACAVLIVDPLPLADLVVPSSNIRVTSPPPMQIGQTMAVNATTFNTGDAVAENFDFVIFDDFDGSLIPGPGEIIGTLFVDSLDPLASISYETSWIPSIVGFHDVCAIADLLGNVTELNESNNLGCKEVYIKPVDLLTTLLVGQPKYVSDHTFITSSTPLTLQSVDLAGGEVEYTEYRVDGGDWTLYVGSLNLPDEGFHLLEYRSSNPNGYLEATRQAIVAVDNTPPTSGMAIGEPSFMAEDTWIRSSTPLTLTANEPSLNTSVVTEVRDINVYLEPFGDNETFEEYLARSNHTVYKEIWPDLESVTFHVWGSCPDVDLGVFYDANDDGERQVSELVDYDADADGDETVTIESPDSGPYIISIAGFTVQPGGCLVDVDIIQTFGGEASSGLGGIQYRVWSGGQWTGWSDYATSFPIPDEGPAYVEFLGFDNLGNTESAHNQTLIVDDTPPHSTGQTTARTDGGYDVLLTFQDDGCGVDVSYYRFTGDDQWDSSTLLEVSLNITSPGNYTIEYYAIDNLGNVENVRSLTVVIKESPPPPTDNWKPLVAAIFAIVLVILGLWASRRRPWKNDKSTKAVAKTFALISMPFVLAEVVTGVVSYLTGLLSIPPAIGAGTFVDLAILLSGIFVAVYYSMKPMKSSEL